MAGKLAAAQGTGILLVTANVGSLFEDVSLSSRKQSVFTLMLHWDLSGDSGGHDSGVTGFMSE